MAVGRTETEKQTLSLSVCLPCNKASHGRIKGQDSIRRFRDIPNGVFVKRILYPAFVETNVWPRARYKMRTVPWWWKLDVALQPETVSASTPGQIVSSLLCRIKVSLSCWKNEHIMTPKHTKRHIPSSVIHDMAFVPSGFFQTWAKHSCSSQSGVLCCCRDASFAHYLPVDGGLGWEYRDLYCPKGWHQGFCFITDERFLPRHHLFGTLLSQNVSIWTTGL